MTTYPIGNKVLSTCSGAIHGGGAFAGCALMLGLLFAGCKTSAPPTVVGDSAVGDANSINRDVANHGDAADAVNVAKPDLPGPAACSGDALAASKGKAEACTCNSDCRSGYCVDGVCCTSACTEGCKACNLPSSLGDCSFIPAGVKPVDPDFCSASTPATCGQDGTCDGQGACRKYVAGIQCKAGTCDGDGISGARTCDGKGSCSVDLSTPCAPYSCDLSTNQCDGDCTTNAQCSAGQQCALQSCGMKLNGFGCKADSNCASGHCADGTCCNLACNGACRSCNQVGSVGRCTLIDEGLPDPRCQAESPSTCSTTGLCDGAGACALFPENTPCGAAACAGSALLNTARVCDGKGTCRGAQLVDCSPYLCSAGDCNGSCTTDADCEPGHQCVKTTVRGTTTGRCGKGKNGQPCGDPSDCESNQCVDGVCCESACDGPCRSCGLPGSPGQCVNVASGATDPRRTCVDHGKASCGTNGVCDGTGACQAYAPGTICGAETCQSGAHSPAGTCNQAGQCVAPPSLTCNPYACNGSSCYISCSSNSQCASGRFCVNGSCGLKTGGALCSTGSECKSGHCAQGVCCNSDCTAACMACNLPDSLGLCTAVADGTPDPQEVCAVTQSTTCKTTGLCKSGKCGYVAQGVTCKGASCATRSSEILPSTCDGAGNCVTPPTHSCGAFICSSAACEVTCKADTDCVAPNTCVKNSCGPKPAGASCTAASQCETNLFCTEGVCCATACDGACQSCAILGKVGTCSPIAANGTPRDTTTCMANPPCGHNGSCDGNNHCQFFSSGTTCMPASCAPAVSGELLSRIPVRTCNGAGSCAPANAVSCGAYQCDPNTGLCKTSPCSSTAADCNSLASSNGGYSCIGSSGNPRICQREPNGGACTNGFECVSGNCVSGTCCGAGSCFVDGACRANGDTNPANQCQQCVSATSQTSWSPKADGTTCSDGNACTQTDTCQSGTCTGSNAVVCPTPDQCHTAGTCAPSTGQCSNPAKADGTACDDGNPSTVGDICTSGVCGGNDHCLGVTCTALDQCHVAGSCNHSTGTCSDPSKPDNTPCSDNNPCTSNDVCTGGACAGTGYACAAPEQCHQAGTCNGDGTCSFAAQPDGTLCSDNNLCTTGDACLAGTCTGTPVDCSSLGGSCNPSTGTCQ